MKCYLETPPRSVHRDPEHRITGEYPFYLPVCFGSPPAPSLPAYAPLKPSPDLLVDASAMVPFDPFPGEPSAGVPLCSMSDTTIVDPWDGNPSAVFSPSHPPLYIELAPLAFLPRLTCPRDDVGFVSDDCSRMKRDKSSLGLLARIPSLPQLGPEKLQVWEWYESRSSH
ncbi:hypothetical protein NE237_020213 [Protea cynaroides]|uniref:Uncharacterized protein n=1 Tax=Protea cynaroides TaxID=273540 RepID=A0A9Q0K3N6_9MAGN|nr:hypothetical protein NE237_020213 [Protea cynaroides]